RGILACHRSAGRQECLPHLWQRFEKCPEPPSVGIENGKRKTHCKDRARRKTADFARYSEKGEKPKSRRGIRRPLLDAAQLAPGGHVPLIVGALERRACILPRFTLQTCAFP